MNPLVSIIIPTYNRSNLIDETLKSVENQTCKSWECIIVDDISNDNSEDFIKKRISNDNRFIFLKRTQNKPKGPSACRNIGIENAKGQFIMFLDSDDLLADNCLQNRINFYLQNPSYDFYIFKTKIFNNTPNDSTIIHNIELTEYTDENYLNLFLLGKTPFCIMSPLWKIQTIKQLNGFDEKLVMLEDPDLHMRTFLSNFKSKTNLEANPDSFYKQNLNDLKEDNIVKFKIKTNQYYYFISKYLILKNKTFEYFALKVYKNIILNKKHFNLQIMFKFYLLFYRNRVLNLKKIICILPLSFLVYINSKFTIPYTNRIKEFIFQ